MFATFMALSNNAGAELPDEVAALKSKREEAITAAVRPIDAKYLQALAALKDKFTKAGNLEKAIAVDNELKAMSDTGTVNGGGALKVSDLDGYWVSKSGGNTYKMANGGFYQGDKKLATLTVTNSKERKVSLQWDSATDMMVVSIGCDMMCGKNKPFGETIWWQRVKQ